MSVSAVIKFAPVYTAERYKNPKWERPGRDFYWSGSLQLLPTEVPLLIDHDKRRRVGVVRKLSEIDWTDGKWICAHVTIDDRPGWLGRSTAASFGRVDVHTSAMGEDAQRVTRAFVSEVSLLSPAVRPAEPLASVLWIGDPEDSSAAGRPTSERSVAGEVVLGPQRIVRYGIGRVLGVR